ncbi:MULTISPECIES: TetR/AcrR family transcriptional regulator [unclassified Bradyrhizobium]|uniref:TetR/AcrR family transcriptional regulator n=1 Tax=unclassified Bradyrhizobium TaxID=2631580 RepID=UPI0011425335|nr:MULTISPECIES: TetR/AcrR family transcriptional regulator [unclassified Bradyrhizobium]MCP1853130.1 AcrR family transcriptional regulator [Bradyrhizobium sp. USDA 4541]
MREQIDDRTRNAGGRRRIVRAAKALYCQIGHNKTTVADIGRSLSMSSANIYRFFRSKQAIEEAVVGELLDEIVSAAAEAGRGGGSVLRRLTAILKAIAECNEGRPARDRRLQDLLASAVRQNWSVVLAYEDQIRGVVRPVIGTGQENGELRDGSPMALTCCLLEALDVYLNPSRTGVTTLRPSFEEMLSFCTGALRRTPSVQALDMASHLEIAVGR